MKKSWHRMIVGAMGIVLVALLSSCAEPPTEKLAAAQKAFEAAQGAGAAVYVKEDFAALEQELAGAKEELAKQEKALSIFRSYTEADRMLTRVADLAKQVESKATTKKEEAKAAALNMEKEAQQAVASAQELIAKAPTGKDRAAVESIKQDLTALESGLTSIHLLIEKGDYPGAEVQAKALKDKGLAVSDEIQQAIDKVKGKGKKSRSHA